MNEVNDHYAVLGLAPGVSGAEVRARFRRLAMDVHPDRNENDPECQERLKRINAAYEFLSDAGRRAAFDVRYSPPPAPLPRPSTPAGPSRGGAALVLALVVFCLVLVGAVAFLVLGGVPGPSADAAPPPAAVTLLDPSPEAVGPAPSVAPAVPASAADGPPAQGMRFWPADQPASPPTGSPWNDAPPAPSAPNPDWPPADTGPFPSR